MADRDRAAVDVDLVRVELVQAARHASACAANASFSSATSTSAQPMPAARAPGSAASTGAIPNMSGLDGERPRPAIRASGSSPIAAVRRLGPSSSAAAPSLSRRGVARRDRPVLRERGLQLRQLLDRGVRRGCRPLVALGLVDAGTGTTIVVEAPVPGLRAAGVSGPRTRPAPRARSVASSASFSALSPSEIVHRSGIRGLTIRQPSVSSASGSLRVPALGLEQHPRRAATSTRPRRPRGRRRRSRSRRRLHRRVQAEPHSRLIVAPGTDVGRPASSTAIRATLRLSSPPLALPNTTSSIRSGSRSGERAAARAHVRRQVVRPHSGQRAPWRPNGVRIPS